MISRRTIYAKFIKYANDNVRILTNKINYYNSRLEMSNNKLDLYSDNLSRYKAEFKIIYGIDAETIRNNITRINYINKTVIDTKNGIKSIILILSGINNSNGLHTVLFIASITKEYLTLLREIQSINRQLQLLNDKLVFFNKYKDLSKNVVYYILSQCNKFYEAAIIDGETVHLGHHLGYVKVVPKKVNGRINWPESLKFKARLLAEGKIPYNKDDAVSALKQGIKYNGVKWFVMYENEVQYYINWYAYSMRLPNKRGYTFKPAKYNKTEFTTKEIRKRANTVEDLNDYHIGIVTKLNAALAVNEMQFAKYAGYDI